MISLSVCANYEETKTKNKKGTKNKNIYDGRFESSKLDKKEFTDLSAIHTLL